ncbi:MAG TPA: hypothetical protein ENF49_04305 [Candidatus Altiarchaeales archaeon]|nr:hypothetical protein [Candidatus Altiarchaeales archaeon]HEX55333.1 hypothetical protein [Candidatus Altiarchaeales archaeon]
MACFLVPMGEAIITSVIQKTIGKERAENLKLSWLNIMLWGGVILLAVEHIWHGEVVPWPPFLTAMRNPAEIGVMLHEMAVIGGSMCIVITLTWIVLVKVASIMQVRKITPSTVRA